MEYSIKIHHGRVNIFTWRLYNYFRQYRMSNLKATRWAEMLDNEHYVETNPELFSPRGGWTTVILFADNQELARGHSRCSFADSYNKKRGVRLALIDALYNSNVLHDTAIVPLLNKYNIIPEELIGG